MITGRFLAAVLLTSSLSTAVAQQTKVWINVVPQYSQLASCAVGPISTIVRGMAAGCGDGGAYTSYSCFCSASSSYYNDLIATSVSKQCSGTVSDVVSAVAVFQSYCELRDAMTTSTSAVPTTSSSSSSSSSTITTSAAAASTPTLSAAATVTTTVSAAASTSSSASSTSSTQAPSSMSTGAKAGIAIGVIAIVVAIAGLVAFFLYQRRRRQSQGGQGASHLPGTTYLPSSTTINETRPPTSQFPPVPFQQKDWNSWQQNSGGSELGSPAPSYNTPEKVGPLIDMREMETHRQYPEGMQELPGKRYSRHELGA